MDLLAPTADDIEAILTLSPVTWLLLYLILREVRRNGHHDRD